MAMIEVGDVVKFAELAWRVYDYGWSPEMNANRQYRDFFHDVEQLAYSLEQLTSVLETARHSVSSRPPPSAHFGWDQNTLLEIVGDFNTTLEECQELIRTNEIYAVATGPVRNVQWNAMVRPSMERLQQRILMHHAKIQHLLGPFEIDLYIRLHDDLARRMSEVHSDVRATQADVRDIRRDMQALRRHFDPSWQAEPENEQSDPMSTGLIVPPAIQAKLEEKFALHPYYDIEADISPDLSEVADAFVRNLDIASPLNEYARLEEERDLGRQYTALLTCQFLLLKMYHSDELLHPTPVSHWPRYVRSLAKELHNCISSLDLSQINDTFIRDVESIQVPPIWEEETPPPYIQSAMLTTAMDHMLELPLVDKTAGRWTKIDLFRNCDGTDRHFRLNIAAGNEGQPAAETRRLDFDIETANLVPRYASPSGQEPLELALKVRGEVFSLEFCSREDLYLFQQALTGYAVVDEYMPYRVKTMFVIDGRSDEIQEYASVQLWQPARLDGYRPTEDTDKADVDHIHGPISSSSLTQTNRAQECLKTLGADQATYTGLPSESPFRQRSTALPINSISSAHPRGHRSTNGLDVTGRSSGLASSPTPSIPIPISRRTSPGVNSQPRPHHHRDQQSPRSSITASVASSSSSSTGTLRGHSHGRQNSISAQSVSSTTTVASTATAKAVSVSGGGNTASVGTLHCKPSEPMLVLFTRDLGGTHGIVAVSLDKRVAANYQACRCTWLPGCRVTAVEVLDNGRSSGSPLPVLRLGGVASAGTWWDVLSLANSMKSRRLKSGGLGPRDRNSRVWQRVIRVALLFETVAERDEFAGHPCPCSRKTEGELIECLLQGHQGRLGLVRESFRREMVEWYNRRYRKTKNMVDKRHQLSES